MERDYLIKMDIIITVEWGIKYHDMKIIMNDRIILFESRYFQNDMIYNGDDIEIN